jgi:hypothetical protein
MEAIIARLLEGFEQGRVDRRQLIKSLAVAATGARVLGSAVPAAAATAASSAAPFGTASLDHISYAVADYGRSRDFYVGLTFDTDAVREELERRGLDPRRDQGTPEMHYDSYHVLDPDCWDLQISR